MHSVSFAELALIFDCNCFVNGTTRFLLGGGGGGRVPSTERVPSPGRITGTLELNCCMWFPMAICLGNKSRTCFTELSCISLDLHCNTCKKLTPAFEISQRCITSLDCWASRFPCPSIPISIRSVVSSSNFIESNTLTRSYSWFSWDDEENVMCMLLEGACPLSL